MTLPLAVLLDYQPLAASVTSAGPFTMETPHHSPPTAPHYRATAASAGPGSAHLSLGTSKLTHCLLLKLIWGQSPETMAIERVPLCLKVWFWFQYNQIGLHGVIGSPIQMAHLRSCCVRPLWWHEPYCIYRCYCVWLFRQIKATRAWIGKSIWNVKRSLMKWLSWTGK